MEPIVESKVMPAGSGLAIAPLSAPPTSAPKPVPSVRTAGSGSSRRPRQRSMMRSASTRAIAAAKLLAHASMYSMQSATSAVLTVTMRACLLASVVIALSTLVPVPDARPDDPLMSVLRLAAMLPAWLVYTYCVAMVFYVVTRVVNNVPKGVPSNPRVLPIGSVCVASAVLLVCLQRANAAPLLVPCVLALASAVPPLVYLSIPRAERTKYDVGRFMLCVIITMFGAAPFVYSIAYLAVFRHLEGSEFLQLLATAVLQCLVSVHCCGLVPLLSAGNSRALHPRLRFFGMFYLELLMKLIFPEVSSVWLFAGLLVLDGVKLFLAVACVEYLTRMSRATGQRHGHFTLFMRIASWFCAPIARAGKSVIVTVTPKGRRSRHRGGALQDDGPASGPQPKYSSSRSGDFGSGASLDVTTVADVSSDEEDVQSAASRKWDSAAWRVKAMYAAAKPDNLNPQERLLVVTVALRLLVSFISSLMAPVFITLGRYAWNSQYYPYWNKGVLSSEAYLRSMLFIFVAFVVQNVYAIAAYQFFLRKSVLKVNISLVMRAYTSEQRQQALCPVASAAACTMAAFVVFAVTGGDQLVNLVRGAITWSEARDVLMA